jgi:hypothetical protein
MLQNKAIRLEAGKLESHKAKYWDTDEHRFTQIKNEKICVYLSKSVS